MADISNYETYLLVSSKKFIISVYSDFKKKEYYEETIIDSDFDLKSFEKLEVFLNQNIFKIEKKFQNFIEKIIIILDLDIFFPLEISVKKDNHNNYLNLQSLKHLLYEAKDCCKKTFDKRKVIHMLIKNYRVNDKSYSTFPKSTNCHFYSLDLEFICISNDFIKSLEIILKKYHISINRILSANYVKQFLTPEDNNIFSISKKIIDGHNPNEVILLEKTDKNQGFFEKFFNFFS